MTQVNIELSNLKEFEETLKEVSSDLQEEIINDKDSRLNSAITKLSGYIESVKYNKIDNIFRQVNAKMEEIKCEIDSEQRAIAIIIVDEMLNKVVKEVEKIQKGNKLNIESLRAALNDSLLSRYGEEYNVKTSCYEMKPQIKESFAVSDENTRGLLELCASLGVDIKNVWSVHYKKRESLAKQVSSLLPRFCPKCDKKSDMEAGELCPECLGARLTVSTLIKPFRSEMAKIKIK